MSLNNQVKKLVGRWTGINRLWLNPSTPVMESPTLADLTLIAQEKFLMLKYNWEADNSIQDGVIICGEADETNTTKMVWMDPWHNGDSMMILSGRIQPDGSINALGSDSVPEGPDWGWRIIIQFKTVDSFRLAMYNILPDGLEVLAVEVEYERTL